MQHSTPLTIPFSLIDFNHLLVSQVLFYPGSSPTSPIAVNLFTLVHQRPLLHLVKLASPKGQFLVPFLFTLYISPISSIVSGYGLMQQQYADYTQLDVAASSITHTSSLSNLEQCLLALHALFTENGLALNPENRMQFSLALISVQSPFLLSQLSMSQAPWFH